MNNTFLQAVESHLDSDDPLVLDIVMHALREYPVPATWTARLLRKARESQQENREKLLSIDFAVFDDQAVKELIQSLQKGKRTDLHRYTRLFDQIAPELLIKYEKELKKYISEADWEFYHFLLNCEGEEQAYLKFHEIVEKIEASDGLNYPLYKRGKRMIDLLIQHDWMNAWEVELIIQEKFQDPFFDVEGLLHVYAMGILREEQWIPQLVNMLERGDEDFLLEEASWALNRYQSDEVVHAVYSLCKSDDFIFPIGVLRDAKISASVRALKKLYNEVDSKYVKDYIIESLCYQFSKDGLPEIEHYINENPESVTVDAEEAAYAFYQVIGEHHPKLDQWKQEALERDLRFKQLTGSPMKKEQKVGRNEPCPCGSGKKYKKCCKA